MHPEPLKYRRPCSLPVSVKGVAGACVDNDRASPGSLYDETFVPLLIISPRLFFRLIRAAASLRQNRRLHENKYCFTADQVPRTADQGNGVPRDVLAAEAKAPFAHRAAVAEGPDIPKAEWRMVMKRTWKAALYGFLAVIAAFEIFALSVSGSEDLTLVLGDRDRIWYVRSGTVVSPGPGKVNFWAKIVPAKESALLGRMKEALRDAGRNPGRLEYVQALQEVDCRGKDAKVLSVLFYDRKDRIVLSRTAPKDAQEIVALADAGGAVGKAVCEETTKKERVPAEE